MPDRLDFTTGKGKKNGVPKPSSSNLEGAAPTTHQMEATNRGFHKVNYDGAVFAEQGKAGISVIIRNSNGDVMASMSQLVQLPTTITQVEAMAARKAAEFALEVGINKVVLEGDSEIVYKDLNNNGPSLALHGHLIQDVKALIPLFSCFCFSHVGRLGNKVAHSLA